MSPIQLDDVLSSPNLPSLPAVAVEVLRLSRDPEIGIGDIADVIRYDPALSGKILKTVNSSFYGLACPCPTVARAMAYLGLNSVKSLVLGFSLVDVVRHGGRGLDLAGYWKRCVYSATAAKEVARLSGACDAEEAFTAALLQDLGMLTIYSAAADVYGPLMREAGPRHRRLPELEKRALGFTHADAGAGLAERWELPREIVEPIRCHHCHGEKPTGTGVTAAIILSCRLAWFLLGDEDSRDIAALQAVAHGTFGFDANSVKALLRHCADEATVISELLNVSIGDHIDVERVLTDAEQARVEHTRRLEQQSHELRRHQELLAREAATDGLTAIANRTSLDRSLARGFDRALALSGRLGLIICDLDEFKRLNDRFGHQAGDRVLIVVARLLRETAGNRATVARYGGEEFALLASGFGLEDCVRLAETARRRIEAEAIEVCDTDGAAHTVRVTASFGAAAYAPESAAVIRRPDMLVNAADRALYAAKDAGRNTVRAFRAKNVETSKR